MNRTCPTVRRSGFTLVELIMVVAILAILSTIGFMSYSSSVTDSRDTTRKTDMGELKVRLRGTKQKLGAYTLPLNYGTLTNSGVQAAYEGMSDSITNDNGASFRSDPKTGKPYAYATMVNRQGYQVAMTLEGSAKPKAYVDGDYAVLVPTTFPSLLLAMSMSGSTVEVNSAVGAGATNRTKFIANGSSLNIPYDMMGTPSATAASFAALIADANAIPQTSDYSTCQAIYEAGKSMGPGTYLVLNASGAVTNTGCVMSPPTY